MYGKDRERPVCCSKEFKMGKAKVRSDPRGSYVPGWDVNGNGLRSVFLRLK